MNMNAFVIYTQEQCVPRFLLFSVKERRSILACGHVYHFNPKGGAHCRALCCVKAVTNKMVWERALVVSCLNLPSCHVFNPQTLKFWRTTTAVCRSSCACNFICVLSLFSRGQKKTITEARVFHLEWPRVPAKCMECRAALVLHPVMVRNCLSHV